MELAMWGPSPGSIGPVSLPSSCRIADAFFRASRHAPERQGKVIFSTRPSPTGGGQTPSWNHKGSHRDRASWPSAATRARWRPSAMTVKAYGMAATDFLSPGAQVKRFPLVGSFFSQASAARGIRQAVRYAWIVEPFAS